MTRDLPLDTEKRLEHSQRQDSLYDQMVTVLTWARENGCYDAYDWIADRFAAADWALIDGHLQPPADASEPCCDNGPSGHTEQQHHDASACFDQTCRFDHPHGGPFPHPCDTTGDASGFTPMSDPYRNSRSPEWPTDLPHESTCDYWPDMGEYPGPCTCGAESNHASGPTS